MLHKDNDDRNVTTYSSGLYCGRYTNIILCSEVGGACDCSHVVALGAFLLVLLVKQQHLQGQREGL